MRIPTEVSAIESKILPLLNSIVIGQRAHMGLISAKKRYRQIMRTHDLGGTPGTLVKKAPNIDAKSMPDEYKLSVLGISMPDTMDAAIEVHEYEGPKGKGYIVMIEVEHDGAIWHKQWDCKKSLGDGVEARNIDWSLWGRLK